MVVSVVAISRAMRMYQELIPRRLCGVFIEMSIFGEIAGQYKWVYV